jgi:hypothetical protein
VAHGAAARLLCQGDRGFRGLGEFGLLPWEYNSLSIKFTCEKKSLLLVPVSDRDTYTTNYDKITLNDVLFPKLVS